MNAQSKGCYSLQLLSRYSDSARNNIVLLLSLVCIWHRVRNRAYLRIVFHVCVAYFLYGGLFGTADKYSNVQGVVKCSSLAAEVGAAVDLPAVCVYQSALLMPDADFSAVSTDSLLQMELAQWLPAASLRSKETATSVRPMMKRTCGCTLLSFTFTWDVSYMRCFTFSTILRTLELCDSS